jgi:ferredoxin
MKVQVDRELCQGNAICLDRAPGVFDLGTDDVAVVLEASPRDELRDDVYDAVLACPMQAVLLEQVS